MLLRYHVQVCLNVKELLGRSRRHIWSLSDSNSIRTHNQLVRKRTLKNLIWLNGWVFVYEQSGCGLESRCCHNVFSLSSGFKRRSDQRIMWFYGWEPFMVGHQSAKFSGQVYCSRGDLWILVCRVMSQDQVIKVSFDFIGRSPSR